MISTCFDNIHKGPEGPEQKDSSMCLTIFAGKKASAAAINKNEKQSMIDFEHTFEDMHWETSARKSNCRK